MQKLFLVYLGGRTAKANIELHDVQFVVAETIEEAYPALRNAWFGNKKGLHIDSYMHVHLVDGFNVEPRMETPAGSLGGGKKLYFINFGGYDRDSIAELHQFGLFVASSDNEAKKAAKKSLVLNTLLPHKDDMFDIDDCIVLSKIGGFHIHLTSASGSQPIKPDWFGYNVIG